MALLICRIFLIRITPLDIRKIGADITDIPYTIAAFLPTVGLYKQQHNCNLFGVFTQIPMVVNVSKLASQSKNYVHTGYLPLPTFTCGTGIR